MRPPVRKLLLRVLFLVLFLSTIMMSINLVCDPAYVFHPEFEVGLARELHSGRNVMVRNNYDERRLQKLLIESISISPDVVVFGSSRSMVLTSMLAPGMRFYNHSVSGSSLEDFIALDECYSRRSLKPGIIILALDPWLLNANDLDSRWSSLSSEFTEGMNRLGLASLAHIPWVEEPFVQKWRTLLSPVYFQSSLRTIPARLRNGFRTAEYEVISLNNADNDLRLADGSLTYGRMLRERTPEQVRTDALAFIGPQGAYRLNHFSSLDVRALQMLRTLVTQWQHEGCKVVFMLSPYHPVVYDQFQIRPEYHKVMATEECYRLLASQLDIPVWGSYNPITAKAGAGDFYDGMHPHVDYLMKNLSPLLKLVMRNP